MLTDPHRELIAAAVDGELSPAQAAAFRRLLARSDEARRLFDQLSANSHRLADARRVPAPPRLAEAVMARVGPTASPAPRPVGHRPWVARLVPFAVAASVFFTAAGVTHWMVAPGGPEPADLAANDFETLPAQPTDPNIPVPPVARPADSLVDAAPAPRRLPDPPTVVADGSARPSTRELAPSPRPRSADAYGSAFHGPPPQLEAVEVRLPLFVAVAEFGRPDVQARVAENLARDPAFRLDLLARDPIKAADQLLAAARSVGLTVAVDAVAQERMKRKQTFGWALYTESLSAAEVAGLLTAVGKAAESSPGGIGSAHLIPAHAAEQKDLKDLLGTDPGLWKRPKAAVPPRSVTAGTAGELAATLTRGSVGEKTAVFLTYLPHVARTAPSQSREVRSFLDRRGERKPTAVPLLVVIVPSAG